MMGDEELQNLENFRLQQKIKWEAIEFCHKVCLIVFVVICWLQVSQLSMNHR